MRTLTVKKNDAGKRIDKFLSKALVNLPQSLLHKYFRKKCVKINGAKANPEDILEENDVITLYISDEFFPDTSPVQNQIADVSGATMFASPDSPVEFSFDKKQEYHLIETRRRGFYKAPRRDF